MVYGDDKEQVPSGAKKLAQKFWDVRKQFDFEAPTYPLDKCLDLALASKKKPFFISDMGDNPSGGGAGDVTWTLARLLKRPELQSPSGKKLLYMSIPGPEMLEAARKAGVGGHAEAMVGAMVDNVHEGPVKLSGKVVFVSPAASQAPAAQQQPAGQPRPVHLPARQAPQAPRNAGLDMAIIQAGSIYVVVTQGPRSFQSDRELIAAGVNPKDMDIVMVKQGYLVNVWYNMQADWVMAHTRGGVDQDLVGLPYKRVIRPIYPLDPDMPDPERNVVFVPSAKHFYGR
jgi:microcystin degradation protein MlrC